MTRSMTRRETSSAWAVGGTVFAATMMVMIGIFQALMGIAAIAKDQFFVVTNNYAYNVDTTTWGWIHLGVGALALVAGIFLFTGTTWARIVGIGLAAISATANFFFIPYYPFWSLLIIALDVFVIWALAAYGRKAYVEGPPAIAAGDETWQFQAPPRATTTAPAAPRSTAGTGV